MSWVAIGIIAFVFILLVGNIMGLRPNQQQLQLGIVRMIARQLQLNPKLIPTPQWLNDFFAEKNSQDSTLSNQQTIPKMIMQYSLVNDEWQLPKTLFLIKKNQLIFIENTPLTNNQNYFERQQNKLTNKAKKLDQLIIENYINKKQQSLLPFLYGLMIQANSISVFLDDEGWAKRCNELLKNHPQQAITADNDTISDKGDRLEQMIGEHLTALKNAMQAWVEQL